MNNPTPSCNCPACQQARALMSSISNLQERAATLAARRKDEAKKPQQATETGPEHAELIKRMEGLGFKVIALDEPSVEEKSGPPFSYLLQKALAERGIDVQMINLSEGELERRDDLVDAMKMAESMLQTSTDRRTGQRRSSLAEQYPKYHKAIPEGMDSLDVYALSQMFPVDDTSGCILHARKKLLIPGSRSGGKSFRDDIKEARDTLNRWLELNP